MPKITNRTFSSGPDPKLRKALLLKELLNLSHTEHHVSIKMHSIGKIDLLLVLVFYWAIKWKLELRFRGILYTLCRRVGA